MDISRANWYVKLLWRNIFAAILLFSAVALAQNASAPVDPGPRPAGAQSISFPSTKFPATTAVDFQEPADANGADGAGNVLSGGGPLTGLWFQGLSVFETVASPNGDPVVSNGTSTPTNILGLGPSFNGESCFQCHSQPTVGGTSPAANPQFATAAHDKGATNQIPSFITQSGPIREARFIKNADGTPDGGVHELFTIEHRSDAPAGCAIAQPDFATQLADNNVSLRIPIATFGEGFVENTPEAMLQSNLANATSIAAAAKLGISGEFNKNGNDGTITRFGWKAQNKSLLLFAGEAANVEMGVTNELFPNEKTTGTSCTPNNQPEDQVNVPATLPANISPTDAATIISSDIENFAVFMRLNGAPGQCAFNSKVNATTHQAQCFSLTSTTGTNANPSAAAVASIKDGQALFGTMLVQAGAPAGTLPSTGIGCVLCHSDILVTGPSAAPSLSNATYHPFSDFALHQMDAGLADGVTQGLAGPNEFRTAPLWGIGQRLFFMHDGRAADLLTAIRAHSLAATTTPAACTAADGEACPVMAKFNSLTTAQQQDILNFLRSL